MPIIVTSTKNYTSPLDLAAIKKGGICNVCKCESTWL